LINISTFKNISVNNTALLSFFFFFLYFTFSLYFKATALVSLTSSSVIVLNSTFNNIVSPNASIISSFGGNVSLADSQFSNSFADSVIKSSGSTTNDLWVNITSVKFLLLDTNYSAVRIANIPNVNISTSNFTNVTSTFSFFSLYHNFCIL
jgi:hypothetical protein